MNQLEKTLTSLEVAEMVGKRHDHVLRDIERIIGQLGDPKVGESYFIDQTYKNLQNKVMPRFLLTKKGCELYSTRMTGEKGTQFAVAYIEKFNAMENHIKQNELDLSQFSPELRALIGIEKRQNEQDIRINKVEKKQNEIKEIFSTNTINWRNKINNIINKVAQSNGGAYKATRNKTYNDLEIRARVDLNRRLNNMKERASEAGATKKEITGMNYLDVIERDQKLTEIYLTIVKELAIKYGLGSDANEI